MAARARTSDRQSTRTVLLVSRRSTNAIAHTNLDVLGTCVAESVRSLRRRPETNRNRLGKQEPTQTQKAPGTQRATDSRQQALPENCTTEQLSDVFFPFFPCLGIQQSSPFSGAAPLLHGARVGALIARQSSQSDRGDHVCPQWVYTSPRG